MSVDYLLCIVMFIYMYLNRFNTDVTRNGEDFIVNYQGENRYGHCIYRRLDLTGSNKPIRQSVMLLTHCQMGDIIDDINETTPLTEKDHDGLSKEIREHSLSTLTSWLEGQIEDND
jgi:hypothetical protein